MKVPYINNNVKKLLLDPNFLEWVFDDSTESSNGHSELTLSAQKILAGYSQSDISNAKLILSHLDENWGYFSDSEITELGNRIKTHLNP